MFSCYCEEILHWNVRYAAGGEDLALSCWFIPLITASLCSVVALSVQLCVSISGLLFDMHICVPVEMLCPGIVRFCLARVRFCKFTPMFLWKTLGKSEPSLTICFCARARLKTKKPKNNKKPKIANIISRLQLRLIKVHRFINSGKLCIVNTQWIKKENCLSLCSDVFLEQVSLSLSFSQQCSFAENWEEVKHT